MKVSLGLLASLLLFDCLYDGQPYAFADPVSLRDHPCEALACLRGGLIAVDTDHAVGRAINAFQKIVRHVATPSGGTLSANSPAIQG
jgi:hypothetical protein